MKYRYDVIFIDTDGREVANTVFTDMGIEYVEGWYRKQGHVSDLRLVRESDNDGIANMVVRL